jgi:hypothetical protein
MQMYKTKHAKVRQQQRGISNETVKLLFQYGKKIHKNDGTAILCFPRKVKSKIESKHMNIKNLKNAYAVIQVKHNRVLTIGHRYKKSLIH